MKYVSCKSLNNIFKFHMDQLFLSYSYFMSVSFIKLVILPLLRILRNVGAPRNVMSGERRLIHLLAGNCGRTLIMDWNEELLSAFMYMCMLYDNKELFFDFSIFVISFSFIVANKWIWTYGNTFRRRCGLHPSDTQIDIESRTAQPTWHIGLTIKEW